MHPASPDSQRNFRRSKVLIIEDNDDQWVLIERAMQQCLSEVKAQRVASVEEAIRQLEDWQHQAWELPRLILLDLYLPKNRDGLELLKQIKGLPVAVSRIPIIILSSSEAAIDISESYDFGVASYSVKPIDFIGWLAYFHELRAYWWETVTLPPTQDGF